MVSWMVGKVEEDEVDDVEEVVEDTAVVFRRKWCGEERELGCSFDARRPGWWMRECWMDLGLEAAMAGKDADVSVEDCYQDRQTREM